MTLKEIAKEAGVSASTVSRVINRKQSAASKEVQDKIWEIVRNTGYSPNSAARDLKTGQTSPEIKHMRSIACIFARTADPINDAFFSVLARGVEQEAFRHNYIVKYIITPLDIDNPSIFHLITDNHVDGAAVLGRCDKRMLSFLKNHFNYVVYSGLNSLNAKYDQVICDGQQSAAMAMEKLWELGHSKIAYLGETVNENRYAGYCDFLAAKNLPFIKNRVINVPMTMEGGYQGALKLLKTEGSFTAVFCSNDITAIGASRALQENKLRIPEDVSLISIDDIEMVQYITPMLTTVHIPIAEMGQMAAKLLIDRIEGGHVLPLKVNLPFSLTTRESCANPKKF